jgi:hypothetical protein
MTPADALTVFILAFLLIVYIIFAVGKIRKTYRGQK